MWHQKFPARNWTKSLIENGNPLNIPLADLDKFVKNLVEELDSLLRTGHTNRAIDRISLGMILDKTGFLLRLKRKGTLRHSTYIGISSPVTRIARHVLAHKTFLGLSTSEVLYFQSLQNIATYASEMKKVYFSIKTILLKYKKRQVVTTGEFRVKSSIFKALLALNDYNFLTRTYDELGGLQSTTAKGLSLEERSDAISFLLSLADELIQIEPSDLFRIDEAFIENGRAERLILEASRYKAFKDFEIRIEANGFVCRKDGKTFRIEHIDENVHKSLDLSHIVGIAQKDANSSQFRFTNSNLPSIREIALGIHKYFPDIIQFKSDPYPRFTMELSTIIVKKMSEEEIGFFIEEHDVINYICTEMFISRETLVDFKITPGLNFNEFLKIHRVFLILQYIYSERILAMETSDNRMIVINSLLALFDFNELLDIFEGIFSKEKVIDYLNAMSWESGRQRYLDLQYTPFIKSGNMYSISLSVLRHSRVARNLTASLAKRGINTKGNQGNLIGPLPDQLETAFRERGFECCTEITINFKGVNQNKGDIDFIAYKEGHLFIAECKDMLDSVDAFEYRRINDYLLKAATQLDYIKSALTDRSFQDEFRRRTNIELSQSTKMHFIIVPSARVMFGHRINDYAVRNIHELTNFVKIGVWKLRIPGGKLNIIELWEEQEFEVSDLVKFCSQDSPHSEHMRAMKRFHVKIRNKYIETKYALDLEEALLNLRARYRFTEIETEDNHT